jgi:hypothetical protein
MPRRIIPAQDHKTVPVVRRAVYADAQTFIKGAVLGINAGGAVIELASNPTDGTVVGVALEDAGSAPGFNVANDNLVVFRTGTEQSISMVDLVKKPDQIFSGRFTDGSGVDVAPTQAIINDLYQLIRLASGEWTVNQAATATPDVQIVDIVLNEGAAAAGNYVLFRFLPVLIRVTAA